MLIKKTERDSQIQKVRNILIHSKKNSIQEDLLNALDVIVSEAKIDRNRKQPSDGLIARHPFLRRAQLSAQLRELTTEHCANIAESVDVKKLDAILSDIIMIHGSNPEGDKIIDDALAKLETPRNTSKTNQAALFTGEKVDKMPNAKRELDAQILKVQNMILHSKEKPIQEDLLKRLDSIVPKTETETETEFKKKPLSDGFIARHPFTWHMQLAARLRTLHSQKCDNIAERVDVKKLDETLSNIIMIHGSNPEGDKIIDDALAKLETPSNTSNTSQPTLFTQGKPDASANSTPEDTKTPTHG